MKKGEARNKKDLERAANDWKESEAHDKLEAKAEEQNRIFAMRQSEECRVSARVLIMIHDESS